MTITLKCYRNTLLKCVVQYKVSKDFGIVLRRKDVDYIRTRTELGLLFQVNYAHFFDSLWTRSMVIQSWSDLSNHPHLVKLAVLKWWLREVAFNRIFFVSSLLSLSIVFLCISVLFMQAHYCYIFLFLVILCFYQRISLKFLWTVNSSKFIQGSRYW